MEGPRARRCAAAAPRPGLRKLHGGSHPFCLRIDTVELKGGLRRVAEKGQRVNRGDIVIEIDLALLEEKAKSTLTPVATSSMDKVAELIMLTGTVTADRTAILRVTKQ
ncbi:PTS glucose transporter subunit IIA [Streptomyces sp. NPDC006995]|uniref:PTS glucose transporter subunit IIA n=1 Tax=Streptomyces sp. NPDC006995 TaxID=3156907 RepID=UPI0033E2E7C8